MERLNGTYPEAEQDTHDDLNVNATIQIGDADVDASNPVPIEAQEVPPTDASQNNPSYVLSYTGANLTQVDMTIGGVTYRKTLGYTGDDLTSVSAWVAV